MAKHKHKTSQSRPGVLILLWLVGLGLLFAMLLYGTDIRLLNPKGLVAVVGTRADTDLFRPGERQLDYRHVPDEPPFFGWFCNSLAGYPETKSQGKCVSAAPPAAPSN